MEKLSETEFDVDEIRYNIALGSFKLDDVKKFYESSSAIDGDDRVNLIRRDVEKMIEDDGNFFVINTVGRVCTLLTLVAIGVGISSVS